jgi:hypothetical protein
MNNKGQFSIIAALLVAVVLIASVMGTYSSIRYSASTTQEQPQIMSSIDETNQALKQLLGFTVGYYGSVLKVTGNASYAQQLAHNYLDSGIANLGSIKPEWALSLNNTQEQLEANWYTNDSYSQGSMNVTYNLNGLGITGVSYSASSRLEVQVSNINSTTQAQFKILTDFGEPLINLGANNIKFFRYVFGNLSWEYSSPTNVISHADGTYIVDLPSGVPSNAYVVQVDDTRGLSVLAASYSMFTSGIAWNQTGFKTNLNYVNNANLNVTGTHGNFTAQQFGPDGIYDNMTEAASGTTPIPSYPTNYTPYGLTTLASGNTTSLQVNDGAYMDFHSYPTAFSSSTDTFGYATKGGTSAILNNIQGSRFTCSSGGLANNITAYLSFTASPGTFGNINTGASGQSIVDAIRGQRFSTPSSLVIAQDITAYIDTTVTFGDQNQESNTATIENNIRGSSFIASQTGTLQSISVCIQTSNKAENMKAAIYTSSYNLIAQTQEVSVPKNTNGWVTFNFVTAPSVTVGTSYFLVAWSQSSSGLGNIYYSTSGSSNQGYSQAQTYASNWPNPLSGGSLNNYKYSIYATYSPQNHNVKAAIYSESPYILVASSQEAIVSGVGWFTFNFASPPVLAASTNYVLVVWAQSGGGNVNLCYSSASGGNGRFMSQTYGNWPTLNPSTDSYQYCIYCDYNTTFNAQAAIYSNDGSTQVGVTQEKTLSTLNSWVTFNFITQPVLLANTNYVLVIWASNTTQVTVYNDPGGQSLQGTGTYNTWPATISNQGTSKYSIYCNYSKGSEYTTKVEFTGNSTVPFPWNDLAWTVDSSVSTSTAAASFQLYNSATGQYPTSGDGYMNATLASGDSTKLQVIAVNPANYLNSSRYWKLMVTVVTSSPYDLNLDFVQYSPDVTNYALNLQEQWTNVNATNPRQDLCIKTGNMPAEPLLVQVLHGGLWQNLTTLLPNFFNNVSLASYIDSTNLTIRFMDGNNASDPTQDSWNIDSVYLQDEPDINYLVNLQQSTFILELLQNGTLRWLGQNMQLTSQTLPIPPIPVKAIHVNETINGVNQEVPFQIEDWASNYQIPLGLTSNTTLFGNRQMIVFLLNSRVTDFTVWWNGSDIATQTPKAYTDIYFTHDNTGANTLTNGNVTLAIGGFNVKATVAGSGNSSTANFMRINQQNSTYGAGTAYVIQQGIVRDIVQQEAEFSNGVTNCPNLYANIVLTLPANATYYTYQLRTMFINSTQARSITDLSPIQLTTTLPSVTIQTENGTLAGLPILQNGTGTFTNSTSSSWTAHHFSQFISNDGKGAGLMYTDLANQNLYAFDSFPASTSKGAINASSGLLQLLPVSASQVSFKSAYDITWSGAVVTFDKSTPICNLYDGTTPMGLWILDEYPPTLTVTPKC